jgi:uncharacterized protein
VDAKSKILVTGATGMIGKKLVLELLKDGYAVSALVRRPESVSDLPRENVVSWHHDKVPSQEAVAGFDAVIHLAGENIADGRWTVARKERIFNSRVTGTSNLVHALSGLDLNDRPKVLLCASAIGIYGSRGDEEISEFDGPGQGFLADLCSAWESEANKATKIGIRVANMRFGVVLAREGGALAKMRPVVIGSGKQWMSWVHIDDIVGFVRHALADDSVSGPFNLTSAFPIRQKDFAMMLKSKFRYPLVFRVPALVIKLALGEMSEIVLESQKVLPKRTLASKYKFRFPTLPEALSDLFRL